MENKKVYFLANVLNIQTDYFRRRDKNMINEESFEKMAFYMRKDGEALKKLLVASEENSEDSANNKLRSFVYQLLNALKTRDSARFMDIVLRLYIGLGKEIPVKFQQILTDEEAFLALGYAFIIGLKGEIYEKKEEIKHE